jgi:hypothetical protein
MGWNNGANSNQLYRPEASRLLTGAPADNKLIGSHFQTDNAVPIFLLIPLYKAR